LLFFLLLPGWLPAQYPIRHLSLRDGLSNAEVHSLLRDSRGFAWVGTRSGLDRLDGRRFRNYASSKTDSSTVGGGAVRGLVEVASGDLWLGSDECLNRYDRRRDTFERVYALDARGRKIPTQNVVIGTDGVTVWYLNTPEGLMAYHVRERRREQLLPPAQLPVAYPYLSGVYRPTGHDLFIALNQRKGVLRFEVRTRRVTRFFTAEPDDRVGQPLDVGLVFFSRDGTGWLVTRQGLVRFSPERANRFHVVPSPALNFWVFKPETVAEDRQGHLWFGTTREGILVFDPTAERVVENLRTGVDRLNGLASNKASRIYFDSSGMAWVSVFPLGIDVIAPKWSRIQHQTVWQLYPKDSVRQYLGQLAEDRRGRIWVTTSGAGPRYFDPRSGATGGYHAADWWPTIGMRALLFDHQQRLWAGSTVGLYTFEPGQATARLLPTREQIRGLLELPDHSVLATTYHEVLHLTPPYRAYTRLDSGSFVNSYALAQDVTRGLIYLSHDAGFRCYRYRQGHLQRQYEALPGVGIGALYLDSSRRCLWLGTNQGLVQFDPARRKLIRQWLPTPEAVGRCIVGIVPDDAGFLWLSTCQGLFRFDPRTGRFYPILAREGRYYEFPSALRGSNGTLYFGTAEGLDYFDPEALRKSPPPRLHFTELSVDDRPFRPTTSLTETRELVLGPDQNTFTLQFAALDYFNEEPTRYQYRLVGQDANFTPPGPENTARYARVRPGHYTFEVRALDWRGEWTPPRRLPVVVQPHFWQTTWFLVLTTLVLAGAVFAAFRFYLRYRLRAQQRLTRQVLAAQEDERRRVAQDLHDDLGNTLAAAKGLLGRLEEPLAKLPPIQEVTAIVGRASDDVRTITHDLMPVEFERYALGDTLRLLVEKTRASSAIAFEFVQAGEERKLTPERELVIYRIVSELITNVRKHSGAKLAVLQLIYQPASLVVSMEDDGVGDRSLSNSSPTPGIGLKNLTSRCEYLSARLTYQADARGTLVLVEIPDAAPRPGARAHRGRPPAV
jgi:signal transduction histidine kinase/ligand-binding sensor domain-containing protein